MLQIKIACSSLQNDELVVSDWKVAIVCRVEKRKEAIFWYIPTMAEKDHLKFSDCYLFLYKFSDCHLFLYKFSDCHLFFSTKFYTVICFPGQNFRLSSFFTDHWAMGLWTQHGRQLSVWHDVGRRTRYVKTICLAVLWTHICHARVSKICLHCFLVF